MAQVFHFFFEICFGCVILHDFPFFFFGDFVFCEVVAGSNPLSHQRVLGFWSLGGTKDLEGL